MPRYDIALHVTSGRIPQQIVNKAVSYYAYVSEWTRRWFNNMAVRRSNKTLFEMRVALYLIGLRGSNHVVISLTLRLLISYIYIYIYIYICIWSAYS